MALAGIELRYLVNQITDKIQDYYVSNIYGITRNSILFKLHHTEKDDIFLMISTSGIWLTSVKLEQMEPNRLQKRLRNDLLRLKLRKITQIGAERVAYLTFVGFGREFVMVGEFFGDGNIILCNSEMKILALQHSIDVRHRKLRVGLKYAPPPESGLDIFDISMANFEDLKKSELTAAKWFGRTLGLPKKYVEGIFGMADVDQKEIGVQLSEIDVEKIYTTTKEIISDVVNGKHEPVIIRGERTEVIPIKFGDTGDNCSSVTSFIAGLDTVFTENLVARGNSIQSGDSEKKIMNLQSQLSEQEKAVTTVKERSENITRVANSLYTMVSDGITSIEDEHALSLLKGNDAELFRERGATLMKVGDQKIHIDPNASLHSIASALFDEAKRQSGAIGSIKHAMANTQKKLDSVRNAKVGSVIVSEIRKKSWYERYRWFFTTDELLAIGGRDAASNSAVIRKHLGKNDRVFHGDIFGSPFFILKDCQDAPTSSMNEVAHATVCFSRAWREGLYGLSAYWVSPEQVKKSAPSGQFLPKGSFTIEGQRNFIKASSLKLAVGIIKQGNDHTLACGPSEPIKKNSVCYAVIEPRGFNMVDTAKKIRLEFLRLEEGITNQISIDDFVRVLPAGQSQVTDLGQGNA